MKPSDFFKGVTMDMLNIYGEDYTLWGDLKDKDCVAFVKRNKFYENKFYEIKEGYKKGYTILICIDKGKGFVLTKRKDSHIVNISNKIYDVGFYLQSKGYVVFKDEKKLKELEGWLFMEALK